MDILLRNTAQGLVPCYDRDYDEKRKLKLGQIYKAKIVVSRNYQFHKKYFALIECAWQYQNEDTQRFFKDSQEVFRKTIQIAAGHCDVVYSLKRREFIEQSKSISFDKMDELEFQELYNRVLDVILKVFIKDVSYEEFNRGLVNFL